MSWRVVLWLLALAASAAACGGSDSSPKENAIPQTSHVITVSSTAFGDGQAIPARFTCDGDGETPPLAWTNVPKDAAALALVVDDPDAPNGTFVHWVVLDLPPDTVGLQPDTVPSGAAQAKNSAGKASYASPCPPSGTHHYRFTVYALSKRTGLSDGADTDTALAAIRSAATAQGRLVGTYEHSS
jgi:Raf kinase inhibitor-like YbhB/YbcL family protein